MDIWSLALLSLFLLLAAAILIVSHLRAWRRFQSQGLADEEFDYRRRQFRRRMQTSSMLGILAIALFSGEIVTSRIGADWLRLTFYCVILVVVFWIALLAAVDIWATKNYFGRLRHAYLLEQIKLQAELRRIQARRANGEAKQTNSEST